MLNKSVFSFTMFYLFLLFYIHESWPSWTSLLILLLIARQTVYPGQRGKASPAPPDVGNLSPLAGGADVNSFSRVSRANHRLKKQQMIRINIIKYGYNTCLVLKLVLQLPCRTEIKATELRAFNFMPDHKGLSILVLVLCRLWSQRTKKRTHHLDPCIVHVAELTIVDTWQPCQTYKRRPRCFCLSWGTTGGSRNIEDTSQARSCSLGCSKNPWFSLFYLLSHGRFMVAGRWQVFLNKPRECPFYHHLLKDFLINTLNM